MVDIGLRNNNNVVSSGIEDVSLQQRFLFCSPEGATTLHNDVTTNDPSRSSQWCRDRGSGVTSVGGPAGAMPRKTDDKDSGSSGRRNQQSRIPPPNSRIPPPKSGRYTAKKTPPVTTTTTTPAAAENGVDGDNTSPTTGGTGRRFDTFVMTGDMIIQTTSPHHKPEPASSPSEKRTREIKGSPVPSKKECKSNSHVKSESKLPKSHPPKTAPKNKAASVPDKKAEPVKEVPASPKLSPKCDNKKQSPVKQSRLPRFNTPKGSPKPSPKASPKASPKKLQKYNNSTVSSPVSPGVLDMNEDETITIDILNANAHNGVPTIRQEPRVQEPSNIESQGPSAEASEEVKLRRSKEDSLNNRDPHEDQRPQSLVLLGYPRFPDVPVELDIPPDDISSEDERYRHELVLDVDDLPPPPEEFFRAEMAALESCQEPMMASNMCLPPPPPPEQSVEVPPPQSESQTEPLLPVTNNVSSPPPLTNGSVSELPAPPLSPVTEAQEPAGFDFRTAAEEESESYSESDDPDSSARELDCLLESLPKPQSLATHTRCASAGDKCYMDYDNHSTCSDSKLEQQRSTDSPARTIVVSKSAEKIAPGKVGQTPTNKPLANSCVRSSKSHENYLECNEVVTFVDIDLEDNLASSVDALHYEQSSTSLDSLGYVQFNKEAQERLQQKQQLQAPRSLDNSPDKQVQVPREFLPTFINLEEPRSISKIKEGGKPRDFSKPRDEGSPTSSPSKSSSSPTHRSSPGSPSKPSAIPVSSATRKPPRPPVRTASSASNGAKDNKPPSETQSPTQSENSPHVCSTVPGHTEEIRLPDVIESPINASHVVDTDLPSEHDEPMATSSTAPSPVAGLPAGAPAFHQGAGAGAAGTAEGEYDVYHQPIKDIDRPSAQRLAKRLFHLDGFKKSDVTRHLCKKNDFSFLVGEEFLKFFDFGGQELDEALRNFLKNLTLAGETQERERVLAQFSRRYMETNPESYNSEDACHTLVCALMLLNTDLHGQNIGRKMTVNEFIENLSDLNDGDNFPREVLKNLYASIRNEPLECHIEEDTDGSESGSSHRGLSQDQQRYLGHNPFLDVPDPNKATEFKKGYVMRKCCMEPDGRKTPMGKRGWKMFYATLRDLVLYLHKDDHAFKKGTMVVNATNCVRIHHALAYRATDYKKKQHVFRLQTSDWAQYLFQTSNSKECQEWIDKINFVSASLSAPPLPGGVGSQKKFQRPLMPATYSRLNLREQALGHEQRVITLDQELNDHRNYPPEKGAKSRVISDYVEKEAYLQFELKRFKVYSAMIQMKLATYPELEPSLVEVTIGEVDEPVSLPSSPEQQRAPMTSDPAPASEESSPGQTRKSKPVQRSQSDRPHSKIIRQLPPQQPATTTPINTTTTPQSMLPTHQNLRYAPVQRHSAALPSAAYETQV